ncbi:Maf family protein, partial [Microvirga pakistanensis]|uniref:Maf family protein n=1 Tax=Microvirga pakistanensis TaxID=1682650 RepID=UPI001874BF91
GADQVLACGSIVFHKAPDREAARRQLLALSGTSHTLQSAFALAIAGTVVESFVATATLTMRPLTDESIDLYLNL